MTQTTQEIVKEALLPPKEEPKKEAPPKKPLNWDTVKLMLQELGVTKDSQRFQLLTKIFNPSIPERLTIVRNQETLVHLNYMKHLAELLGPEYGSFIQSLYDNELDLSMSVKGIGLDQFTTILEQQQNASEITVKNQSIPQQLAEPKRGLLDRLRGKGEE